MEHLFQHIQLKVMPPRERPQQKRSARRLIIIFRAQVQQQHHINAERFRRIQFRHHTGDIIVIQQIYFQIKILILLHYSFYFNKLFTKIILFGRANSVSTKVF